MSATPNTPQPSGTKYTLIGHRFPDSLVVEFSAENLTEQQINWIDELRGDPEDIPDDFLHTVTAASEGEAFGKLLRELGEARKVMDSRGDTWKVVAELGEDA